MFSIDGCSYTALEMRVPTLSWKHIIYTVLMNRILHMCSIMHQAAHGWLTRLPLRDSAAAMMALSVSLWSSDKFNSAMLGQFWTKAFTPASVKLELSLRLTDRSVLDEIDWRPFPVMCFNFFSFNSSTFLRTKNNAAMPLSGGIWAWPYYKVYST